MTPAAWSGACAQMWRLRFAILLSCLTRIFGLLASRRLPLKSWATACAILMVPTGAFAQAACSVADMQALGTVYSEDFGTGAGRSPDPNVLNHNYKASGTIQDDEYAVGRSSDMSNSFMRTAGDVDADGNTEGRYLGINMRGRREPSGSWTGEFYRVDNIALTPGALPPGATLAGFQFSTDLAGTCANCPDIPNFTLIIENSSNGAQLASRTSAVAGVANDDIWRTTTVEVIPAPSSATNVNLVLFNSQPSGAFGNDVGVDNIVFSSLICVPPELELEKDALLITNVVGDAGTAQAGDIIRYTYTVENTGSTTGYNVSIAETTFTGTGPTPVPVLQSGGADLDGGNGTPTDLEPGATMIYRVDYVLTQADINAGLVDNQATITYEDLAPNTYTDVSDSDTGLAGEQVERTTIPTTAELNVGKGASVGALQPDGTFDVAYTITIENTGTQSLAPLTLVDDLTAADQLGTAFQSVAVAPVVSLTNTSGGSTAPTSAGASYDGSNALLTGADGVLQPGDVVTVTFTATLTNNGAGAPATLQNTARATGTPPSGPAIGDDSDADTQADGSPDTTPNDPNDPVGAGVPTQITIPTPPQTLYPVTPQTTSQCTPLSTVYSELFDDGTVAGFTSDQNQNPPTSLLAPTNNIGNLGGTITNVTYHPSLNFGNGVPSPSGGGFIGAFDARGNAPTWTSPSLGGADWSAAVNGALYFERFVWAPAITAANYGQVFPEIIINGPAGRLELVIPIASDAAALATGAWVPVDVRLAPSPEWTFFPATGGNRQATFLDFVAVLSNVDDFEFGPEKIAGRQFPSGPGVTTPDTVERYAIDAFQVLACNTPGGLNAGKGVAVGPLLGDSTFDATYTITVENSGTVPLAPLSLTDDLTAADTLGTAFNGVVSAPVVTLTNLSGSSVAPSSNGAAFDGTNGLITGADGTLQPGDSYTVVFTVNVDPSAPGRPTALQNTALAGGTPPSGPDVFDETDTDTQPDGSPDPVANDPNDPPGRGVPTILAPPAPSPSLSVGKGASVGPVDPDGTFEVTYTVTYLNTGTGPDILDPVTLEDNLANAAQLGTAFNGVTSAPVVTLQNTSGNSTAPTSNGAAYDGTNGLVTGADGRIFPGDSFTVVFTVDVDPNAAGAPSTLRNTARGTGIPPAGPPAVGDDSDTDTNPDGSPENIPNEADDAPGDGVPTIITAPEVPVPPTPTGPDQAQCTLPDIFSGQSLDVTGLTGAGGAFTQDIAGNPVVATTVSGTTSFNDPNHSVTGSGAVIRYEDPAPANIDQAFTYNQYEFAQKVPVRIVAGSSFGAVNSNMNQNGDILTFTAINPTAGFTWVVNGSTPATTSITISPDGTVIELRGPAGSGAANFAQFDIGTSGELTGFQAVHKTNGTAFGGLNSTQFELQVPFCPTPALNVGKGASLGPVQGDGTVDVTYSINVANTGDAPLSPLTLVDDLTAADQLGTAFQSVTSAPVVSLTNTSGSSTAPTSNGAAYDGSNALLTGTDGTLQPGDSIDVVFTVNIDANAAGAPATLQNTARATGLTPGGVPGVDEVGDDSDADTQADGTPDTTPNDPNDPPGGGVPTVISPPVTAPEIGATKSVLAVGAQQGDGSYDATYEIEVTNTGNVTLTNLTLEDNLTSLAQLGSAFRSVVVAPAVTAGTINAGSTLPTANAGYDGTNGLINTSGTLIPGDSYVVTFTVNVNPSFVGAPITLRNMATASGEDPSGTTRTDDSDAGTNAAGGPDTVPDVPGGPGVPTLLPTPSAQSGVTIVKQVDGNRTDFRLGEIVPYRVVATNDTIGPISNVSIVDTLPVGLTYVPGTATLNGVPATPSSVIAGRQISYDNLNIAPGAAIAITLSARLGANAPVGALTNQAGVYDNTGTLLSNIAEATIQRIPDEVFDCTDIIGKVYDDLNRNGYQDGPQYVGTGDARAKVHEGEPGLAGVRVATARGTLITTDEFGRFHVPCAELPDGSIGGNVILKVDTRTLPTGYRMTSENPRVLRVTAGKLAKINFGASISRVVDIDLTGTAFERNSDALKQRLEKGLTRLLQQIQDEPSVIRIAYYHKDEPRQLRQARVRAVEDYIQARWKKIGRYKLDVEVTVTPVQ
ncbi:MAG: hypothetical protein AAF672_06695 [Pseudomonadota bacterium]